MTWYIKWWKGRSYNQQFSTQQNLLRFDGEIKSFSDKQKLREFSITKPVLQQMLKGTSQGRKHTSRKKLTQNKLKTIKKSVIGWYLSIIRASNVVLVVKNPPATAGGIRDMDLIPGSGRSPGVGNGNPLQCSCLKNPMDRGAWWAAVHGVAKSWTQWSSLAHTTSLYLTPQIVYNYSISLGQSCSHYGLQYNYLLFFSLAIDCESW